MRLWFEHGLGQIFEKYLGLVPTRYCDEFRWLQTLRGKFGSLKRINAGDRRDDHTSLYTGWMTILLMTCEHEASSRLQGTFA